MRLMVEVTILRKVPISLHWQGLSCPTVTAARGNCSHVDLSFPTCLLFAFFPSCFSFSPESWPNGLHVPMCWVYMSSKTEGDAVNWTLKEVWKDTRINASSWVQHRFFVHQCCVSSSSSQVCVWSVWWWRSGAKLGAIYHQRRVLFGPFLVPAIQDPINWCPWQSYLQRRTDVQLYALRQIKAMAWSLALF